jgi:glycerophosphoryl diester phosphodiesterase
MAKTFWTRYRGAIVGIVLILLVVASVLPAPGRSVGAYVYELIRRCPEPRRPVAESFLVIGHRGAAGHAIENTIPSMDSAIALGANAIEIDLSMTRDSAVILWHDWLPDDAIAQARQTGVETDVLAKPLVPEDGSPYRRATHELTLAEIREHFGYAHRDKDSTRRLDASIPTLEEFLAWAAGKPELRAVYLDIKVPDTLAHMGPAFIARIERTLAGSSASFDVVYLVAQEQVFNAVEAMLPEGNISFDREPPPGMILDPCEYGSSGVALAKGNREASIIIPVTSTFAPWTTARRIAECDIERSRGNVRVVIGTMNDPEKLSCLVGLGVQGIFTDYPERLRALVGGGVGT